MGRRASIAVLPLCALALLAVPLAAQSPDPYADEPAEGATGAGAPTVADAGAPEAVDAATDSSADEAAQPEGSAGAGGAAPPDESSDYEPLSDSTQRCVAAFRNAQKLRRKTELLAARQHLLSCLQPGCPAILTDKCTQWIREVDDAMPSVVIEATDSAGRSITTVRVTADGKRVLQGLTERPLQLDPCDQLLRFEHPGAPVLRKWVVLRRGEKRRRVTLAFSDTPQSWYRPVQQAESSPPDEPGLWSPLAIGGLSLGAAALTIGGITGVVAMNQLAEIEESCPNDLCPPELEDDFDRAATISHLSTGSFIVGGVAATIGILAIVEAAVRAGADAEGELSARASGAVELRASPLGAALRGWF